MTITSADLMVMLRASMNAPSRPSPGYVVGELESPTGGRRADALFLPLGHARRGEIHGYEFKISRSDLITELNDPMKADPWLRYCNSWNLLVSDAAIVSGLTIPDAWGILAPPATGRRALTVIRPAPKLAPLTVKDPALLQVIARLYYGDGVTEARLLWRLERAESMAANHDIMRDRALTAERKLGTIDPTTRRPHRDLVEDLVHELDGRWTDDYRQKILETFTARELADLLTDLARLRHLTATLAAAAAADLADLEKVHGERGNRLKAARKILTARTPN